MSFGVAIAAVVPATLLLTSLTGACSISCLLGWSTCPIRGNPQSPS